MSEGLLHLTNAEIDNVTTAGILTVGDRPYVLNNDHTLGVLPANDSRTGYVTKITTTVLEL